MEYQCISADCHVDLCWLPHDLFVSNASKVMKDRMPYVTQGRDTPRWVTKSGVDFGFANGPDPTGAIGGGYSYKYIPGVVARYDRMATTGLYSDGAKGIFRPTTPELRLQDQDRDGIQAEVLYGLHSAGYKLKNIDEVVEFYRIYNDWLHNFCNYDRKRFVGLASIPSNNVEVAVAETRRVAKLGLGGLDFLSSWDMIPLWNPYWEPFWKTAAEVNLPVHFHTIGMGPAEPIPEDLPKSVKVGAKAAHQARGSVKIVDILASVMYSGALERYPNLRIVLGESGIGWIPYILGRMDGDYENRFKRQDFPIKMMPSEYWRRQCRATFQNDPAGAMLLDILGEETVMWASDYPHGDSVFPDSQEYIQRQFSHLPEAKRRKVICENAGKFYGLM